LHTNDLEPLPVAKLQEGQFTTTGKLSGLLQYGPAPVVQEVGVDSGHHNEAERFDTTSMLMTEAAALEHARGVYSDAPASALLARYGDIAAANPALAASAFVHPDRLAWVVTVYAEATIRGGPHAAPESVRVYSMVINAELGSVLEFKDVGFGDEAIQDGKLVVTPVQQGHDLSHDPAAGPLAPNRGQKPRA